MLADGVRLVRSDPGPVAVWALVYFAMSAGIAVAMEPILEIQFEAAVGLRALSSGETWTWLGKAMLIGVAALAIIMVLFTATQRAVLRPEEEGFAYLRLGMDELRLVALAILYVIAFHVAILASVIVLGVIAAIIAGITGNRGILQVAAWAEVGLYIIGGTWCFVRLSLSFPLTFARRRFVVGEAWRLSRRPFWTLFGAYFAIALTASVSGLVIGAVTTQGPYFADVIAGGFDPARFQEAGLHALERQLTTGFDAATILGWALYSVVGTLALAVAGGAMAIAAHELVFGEAEAAAKAS